MDVDAALAELRQARAAASAAAAKAVAAAAQPSIRDLFRNAARRGADAQPGAGTGEAAADQCQPVVEDVD